MHVFEYKWKPTSIARILLVKISLVSFIQEKIQDLCYKLLKPSVFVIYEMVELPFINVPKNEIRIAMSYFECVS